MNLFCWLLGHRLYVPVVTAETITYACLRCRYTRVAPWPSGASDDPLAGQWLADVEEQ